MPPDRESTKGGGSADRRVPALRAAEHACSSRRRGASRLLAYHRRARLEATIGGAFDKVHRQSRVACIRCAGSIAPILRVPPLRRPRSLHPENLRSSPRQRIPRCARTNRYRSASLLAPWTRREAREGTIG